MRFSLIAFLFFNIINAQSNWTKYNVQFGGEVELPSDFKKGVLVASGTLQWFESIKYPEIEITIESFGTGTEAELDKTYKDDLKSFNGIVYKVKKNNWFVISGVNEDKNIFYNKSIIKNGVQFHLRITYPEKHKTYMNKILSKISNSFK
jgi:hypothetical protein